jgi:hypothetical protein
MSPSRTSLRRREPTRRHAFGQSEGGIFAAMVRLSMVFAEQARTRREQHRSSRRLARRRERDGRLFCRLSRGCAEPRGAGRCGSAAPMAGKPAAGRLVKFQATPSNAGH